MDPSRDLTIGPADGPRVLLLHGLSGSPTELWPLAASLAEAGFRARLPLLPGHGGDPGAMRGVTADDLLAHLRSRVKEPPSVLVGFSMGALLALAHAAELPELHALVLLAPAVRLSGASRLFQALPALPLLGRVLVPKGNLDLASMPPLRPPPPVDHPRLDRLPLGWGRELRRLRARARAGARRVRAPTLLLHGTADRTSDPRSSLAAATWLGARAEVALVPGGTHQLVLGESRNEVAARVLAFARRHLPPREKELPAS